MLMTNRQKKMFQQAEASKKKKVETAKKLVEKKRKIAKKWRIHTLSTGGFLECHIFDKRAP